MAGIKESKELLTFVVELVNAMGASLADGKVTFGDISNFWGAFMDASQAIQGVEQVPAEIKDLDDGEKIELMALAANLKLPAEQLELGAQLILKVAVQLAEFMKLWKA